ncbi:MAG: Bacterial sugar transferase [Parcubacteria group bacterium GW2011_GWA2_52_8]|nr:MAG: Bacterial sugar transferase [Parcubacteria group bacterium GW2011_GWA2_52_8]
MKHSAHVGNYMLVKRAMDIIGATSALVLLLPVMIVIAIAIKITDGCPVVYCQRRLGRFREPFTIYKFRTMHRGADSKGQGTQPNDPRVIAAGRVLRHTHLDNLPQLINVLQGKMSILGPQAHSLAMCRTIDELVPDASRRYRYTPGVTGPAQVAECLDHTTEGVQKNFDLDVKYTPTFLGDLSLMIRTVLVVLQGKGE